MLASIRLPFVPLFAGITVCVLLATPLALHAAVERPAAGQQSPNVAQGRRYSVSPPPSPLYPDSEAHVLTDGKAGSDSVTDCPGKLCAEGWIGFDQGQPSISIDLEKIYTLERVAARFLRYPSANVFPPAKVSLLTSLDGAHWHFRGEFSQAGGDVFAIDLPAQPVRFVRLIAERNTWVFIDEVRAFGNPVVDIAVSEPLGSVLFVSSTDSPEDETLLRMTNLLDGLGVPFDVVNMRDLPKRELSSYQLLIVAASPDAPLEVTPNHEQTVVSALTNGVNVLWIGNGIWGSFKTTALPDAFGLRYLEQRYSQDLGIADAVFANLAGESDWLRVDREVIRVVEPAGASVEAAYRDERGKQLAVPLITRLQRPGHGAAMYISLSLLEKWQNEDAPDAYARAEILAKAVLSLLTEGIALKHPNPDAHHGVFMLRLEDYAPGGLYLGHTGRFWINRMERLLELGHSYDLPINIALVPRYSHPFYYEHRGWTDDDPAIQQLRRQAQLAFARGGDLIVHGYDHQNGDAIDDYTGSDWETWDEDTQQFLSYADQQAITKSAYDDVYALWGVKPAIWETPHYTSNQDTYRAARDAGFSYFNEADTKLFPNRAGYRNKAQGLLLNIPETGSYFPLDAAAIKRATLIKQRYTMPRLFRLSAPFLVFYHNMSERQHKALSNLLLTMSRFNPWKPSLHEYARFWENRAAAEVNSVIDRIHREMTIAVKRSFPGFTVAVRLPNGTAARTVTVDGRAVDLKPQGKPTGCYLYPVLGEGEHRIVVQYQHGAECR